jgi:hypothetical protein
MRSSDRLNSLCNPSTMASSTFVDFSRSALPNLIPRIVQFASKRDFGVCICTMMSTKASQSGPDFLTASVIADCNSLRVTKFRVGLSFGPGAKCSPQHDLQMQLMGFITLYRHERAVGSSCSKLNAQAAATAFDGRRF